MTGKLTSPFCVFLKKCRKEPPLHLLLHAFLVIQTTCNFAHASKSFAFVERDSNHYRYTRNVEGPNTCFATWRSFQSPGSTLGVATIPATSLQFSFNFRRPLSSPTSTKFLPVDRRKCQWRTPTTIPGSAVDGGNEDKTFTTPSPTSTSKRSSILCVGETLWDSLPDGMYLGGAPTNVAVHVASLFPSSEKSVAVASCVGSDRLGMESIRRLSARGVQTHLVQQHVALSTGMVVCTVDSKTGDAISYNFDTPAAWDCLVLDEELQRAACEANVLIIGTIASRLEESGGKWGYHPGAASAETISTLRRTSGDDKVVLDVNLRPPWFHDAFVISLARGSSGEDGLPGPPLALLKVNEEELPILEGWCGMSVDHRKHPEGEPLEGKGLRDRMKELGLALNALRVCVTRGEKGAALWCDARAAVHEEVYVEKDGYTAPNGLPPGSDTVGAGDAFLAAVVSSLLVMEEPAEVALERGCALGGYVATCQGAVPPHSDAPKDLRDVFSF